MGYIDYRCLRCGEGTHRTHELQIVAVLAPRQSLCGYLGHQGVSQMTFYEGTIYFIWS